MLGDAIAQLRHDDLIDESFANKWLDTFLCLGHRSEITEDDGDGDLRRNFLLSNGGYDFSSISLDFPTIYWGNPHDLGGHHIWIEVSAGR